MLDLTHSSTSTASTGKSHQSLSDINPSLIWKKNQSSVKVKLWEMVNKGIFKDRKFLEQKEVSKNLIRQALNDQVIWKEATSLREC